MKRSLGSLFCLLLASTVSAAPVAIGRIENVRLDPGDVILRAKIDTGADHCSLNAQNVEYFQKGKEQWARLTIRTREGEQKMLELKVERQAKIKRDRGAVEKRPVVRLGICLGSFYMMVNANLNDRSDLAYPMLIGQDYLTGHLIVDTARSYTMQPSCEIRGKKKAKTKDRGKNQH